MNIENNKIIAEFMDLKPVKVFGNYSISKDHVSVNCENSNDAINSFCKSTKYHSDWNWLMEVVESVFKVEEFIKDDLIFKLNDTLLEVNKTSLYNACLDCIKWYNLQK